MSRRRVGCGRLPLASVSGSGIEARAPPPLAKRFCDGGGEGRPSVGGWARRIGKFEKSETSLKKQAPHPLQCLHSGLDAHGKQIQQPQGFQ